MSDALSRRGFLGSLGAMAFLPLDLRRTEPALVLQNANIVTMDADNPRAQAVYPARRAREKRGATNIIPYVGWQSAKDFGGGRPIWRQTVEVGS